MDDRTEAVVRRATPRDEDAVVALFDAYRQFYGQEPDTAAARRFVMERFASEDSVIFLAHMGKTPAGFTQLYPSYSSVAMRRVWVLNDLYVLPAFRRGGLGGRLIDAAIDYAGGTGAVRLVLATAVDNAPAKALYERRGWRLDARFDHYQYPLPPPDDGLA